MSSFEKNLIGKLATKEEKRKLRKKLKAKIAAKKQARSNKITRKMQNEKVNKETFRLNNNSDIRVVSIALMNEVEQLHRKGIVNPIKKNKILAEKYEFFVKNYFGMYMGILKRELPIEILDMMLGQKAKIDKNEVTAEQASLAVGDVFAKKLNVDVDSLVREAEINKKNFEK